MFTHNSNKQFNIRNGKELRMYIAYREKIEQIDEAWKNFIITILVGMIFLSSLWLMGSKMADAEQIAYNEGYVQGQIDGPVEIGTKIK